MRDAEIAVVWDAHLGGYPVCLLGIESRPLPRARLRAGRRPRPVDGGHALPAVVEEGGARHQRRERQPARWWCWPTSRASTARRSRCASCSSSTAPRSAARWSTSTGPIVFCVVSRYHGGAFVVFSRHAQRQHGGDRRRGLVRVGDRRRAGGGRRSSPARWTPAPTPIPASSSSRRPSLDGRRAASEARLRAALAETLGGRARREARRGGRRVRPRPQRRAGAAGGFDRAHHPGRAAAALPDRGRRAGHAANPGATRPPRAGHATT